MGQVWRRRWGRSSCDGAVLSRWKPASESFRAFAEHAQESLFLAWIKLSLQPVEQLRSVDEEFHQRNGPALGFDGHAGKPHHPARDVIFLVGRFESFVVVLAPGESGCR